MLCVWGVGGEEGAPAGGDVGEGWKRPVGRHIQRQAVLHSPPAQHRRRASDGGNWRGRRRAGRRDSRGRHRRRRTRRPRSKQKMM